MYDGTKPQEAEASEHRAMLVVNMMEDSDGGESLLLRSCAVAENTPILPRFTAHTHVSASLYLFDVSERS